MLDLPKHPDWNISNVSDWGFLGVHHERTQKEQEFQMCGIPPLKTPFGGSADHRAARCHSPSLLQKNTANEPNKEMGLQSLERKNKQRVNENIMSCRTLGKQK